MTTSLYQELAIKYGDSLCTAGHKVRNPGEPGIGMYAVVDALNARRNDSLAWWLARNASTNEAYRMSGKKLDDWQGPREPPSYTGRLPRAGMKVSVEFERGWRAATIILVMSNVPWHAFLFQYDVEHSVGGVTWCEADPEARTEVATLTGDAWFWRFGEAKLGIHGELSSTNF